MPAKKPSPPKVRRERTAAQKAAAARNLKHGPRATTARARKADERVAITYAVQPDDSLESIAAAFDTDPDALFAANRDVIGSTPRVEVGMPLAVTVTAAAAAALEDGATSTGATGAQE